MGKFKFTVASLFVLVSLFTGAPSLARKIDPPAKVTVGVSPATSTAGIFFAQEMGFFKDENLDVELQVFPTSTAPMIPLLAKGDLDVGGGVIAAGLFSTSPEVQAGILLVADKGSVRKNADYLKLMVRTDLVTSGRYKELKDLKGFRVGLTALGGTSQEATFALFLKKAGLTPKDVTFVKAGYADANKAFASKALDAYIQIEPYLSEAEKSGVAKVVAGTYEIHPDQQSAGIFYSPQFVAKRRDIAVRFMSAYVRGCRAYNKAFLPGRIEKDFNRGVEILTKWTSVKDQAIYNTMIPAGLHPDGKLNLDSIRSDLRYYFEQKYLKSEPDLSKVVDTGILEEALLAVDGPKPGNTPTRKKVK
jgi:NitT/TauT family transport system substrate-binding protein